MLTAKNCKASGAVRYFTDYYDAEQTRWFGKGANALGLVGAINKESFENICYGKSPDGSRYLGTQGDPEKRRSGTDFTFSAPKSVSLTALVGGDTRLEIAHRLAVEQTLTLIEDRYAQTRITHDKQVTTIPTGNLVVAQFDHIESRELDPHLHTHALVMNLTQAENGKWYANDNDRIFQNKKHLGTIYQSYLATEVEKLGYEIEPRPHGQFEIKGYEREDLVEFSKRRMQILSECPGKSTWQTREESWSRTRKDKEHTPPDELKARWQKEAADLGIEIVRPQEPIVKPPTAAADKQQFIDRAIAHCSERSVDFRVEDLEKFILAQRLPIEITEVETLCHERSELIKLVGVASVKENRHYTTERALAREEKTIAIVRRGRGEVSPIAPPARINDALATTTLNAGQRQAVRLVTNSTDRVTAWQGVAGAGKTFALAQVKKIADLEGFKVKGFAPSAEAAKVLGDELRIEAQTVARKICSTDESPDPQRLWVVDEAGLLSADDALALLSKAERENARVLLVGDTRQLSSVGAGNPFKSLQAAGMDTARLSVSLRQQDPNLKAAVDALADGALDLGFSLLAQNDHIVTTPKDEIAASIAAEYLELNPTQRAKTLIVSGTNERRREITAAIREGLRERGEIGTDYAATQLVDYKFTQVEDSYAHNYSPGDIVVPIHDRERLLKGHSYRVERVVEDNLLLTAADGDSRSVSPKARLRQREASACAERQRQRISTDLAFKKAHYRQAEVGVAVGDRLRWTKNDNSLGRRNGQEFTIAAIADDLATIKYRDGRAEIIDLRQAHHFDLAMATTIYSSQGKTSERVLVAADGIQSAESFYVAASRAKQDLKIYTDAPEELRLMVMESSSNRNPRELISQFYQRQAILATMPPSVVTATAEEISSPSVVKATTTSRAVKATVENRTPRAAKSRAKTQPSDLPENYWNDSSRWEPPPPVYLYEDPNPQPREYRSTGTINGNIVIGIQEIYRHLGQPPAFTAGNYHVKKADPDSRLDKYDIYYRGNLCMSVEKNYGYEGMLYGSCERFDASFTIEQYERGLSNALNVKLEELSTITTAKQAEEEARQATQEKPTTVITREDLNRWRDRAKLLGRDPDYIDRIDRIVEKYRYIKAEILPVKVTATEFENMQRDRAEVNKQFPFTTAVPKATPTPKPKTEPTEQMQQKPQKKKKKGFGTSM